MPLCAQAQDDSLYLFKGEPQRLSPIQISNYYPQSTLTDSANVIYYANFELNNYKLTAPEFGFNRVHLLVEKKKDTDKNSYKILNVYLLPIREYPAAKHILTKKEQRMRRKLEQKILQGLSACTIFIQYKSNRNENISTALLGEHKGFQRIVIMITRKPN